jgi:streptogramin lyase
VDLQGNVWVANRNEAGGGKGSVTRVGLITGGTRSDADGTPNLSGQYLKPPYDYNTCVDQDDDGLIKTSSGLLNILPWTNAGGADVNGGVSTADDECIINYTRVAGTNARAMAIDANNDLWVGGYVNKWHEKVDGVTGQPVTGTAFNFGCGGYGGLIDGNNVLWSAGFSYLLRVDLSTTPASGRCLRYEAPHYGLGIDGNGFIWNSMWTRGRILKLHPDGSPVGGFPKWFSGTSYDRGVAVTLADNNVWVANSGAARVTRLDNNGTTVAGGIIPVGATPTGVAVDAAGKVWVTNYNSHSAMRIDPATNSVDLTVHLGGGAYPYNYSDMTGSVLFNAIKQGTWTVTHDGGQAGIEWGTITWNDEAEGDVPEGASITVEARASDTDPSTESWIEVTSGDLFSLTGQFIEIRATLQANADEESPILSDLTVVPAVIDVAIDIKPGSCPNPLNIDKKGVVPVAILGTDEFDVAEVDPPTVLLEGVAPLRWATEDVSTPFEGDLEDRYSCTEEGPDGIADLTLKYDAQEVAAALGAVADGDEVILNLTGMTIYDVSIEGQDIVFIIDKGK